MYYFFFHWEWHSGITHHYRWLQMIDWMIECVLETRVLALSGDNPAAVVKRIAVLLSCDEAKSPGTDGGPCLSISVTVVWVFLPSGPVTHSSTAHWHRLPGPPCHKHVHLIWGLMSTSLEHHRGSAVPLPTLLYGCLHTCLGCNLDKCMEGADQCMQRSPYMFIIYTHARVSPSPALSVSGACVVASWWAQLEFHTQLGSSSNGDWHVPANPLHTAATLNVYIPDLYCIIGARWWQMTKRNGRDDLCVAHSKLLE